MTPAHGSTSFSHPLRVRGLLRFVRQIEFPRKLGICRRLFGRALARHGMAWVQTAAGPVWKLDLRNDTHQWLVFGCYEGPGFWRWLRRHHASMHTIVDSGANIGQTIVHFSTLAPQARILAYEPGAGARAWLTECVAANHLSNVSIHAAGLGVRACTARLADDGGPGQHGSWNKVNADVGEPISLVTLDDELGRFSISQLDLWKLDMEGYEGFALRGAERALTSHRIAAIYMEVAGDSGRENVAYLERLGYHPHHIDRTGRLGPWRSQSAYENVLCLPATAPTQ